MALELIYTSAVRGLRAGTSGFCTVAMTKGLPPALVPRLEALGIFPQVMQQTGDLELIAVLLTHREIR